MNLLACLGLVWIIKDSHIFSTPREWLKSKSQKLNSLLSCGMCLGFWVGLGLSLFEYYNLDKSDNLYYYPFAVSAFCWFFDSLLNVIQEQYVKLKTERESKESPIN